MIDDEPVYPMTTEDDEGLVPKEVRLCRGCGMPETIWENGGRGYDAGDDGVWCCGGCYAQTGCTCA
jgi:hypothetical protein